MPQAGAQDPWQQGTDPWANAANAASYYRGRDEPEAPPSASDGSYREGSYAGTLPEEEDTPWEIPVEGLGSFGNPNSS